MSLKFYETVKSILSDVEVFLTVSLKSVSLPKSIVASKEDLLVKVYNLRQEFPQLDEETKEKSKTESVNKDETQEIYDAIGDDTKHEENVKQSCSSIDVCETVTSLSAADLSSASSMSGNLVRKNIGKSKVDLKNIFLSVFGKKYCLISGGIFFFYDKLSSKRANGSFALKGYEARVLSDQSSKKEFCFELVCPGQKSYIFAATTQEEMDKWVAALNREALTIPDARLSVFCEEKSVPEDEDLEYEDPSLVTIKPLSSDNLSQSVFSGEDEVYDDVAPQQNVKHFEGSHHQNSVDDGAIYDDGESKVLQKFKAMEQNSQNDDLLYEAYDDAQTNLNVSESMVSSSKEVEFTEKINKDVEVSYEKFYYGKWDCRIDSDNELAFKRGDIIEILSQDYDRFGWWIGCLKGVIGLVPKEYVTPAYELICS